MPKGMSDEVAERVVDALQRGQTRGQIAGVLGVSKRAITRISSNMKRHGQPKPPPTGAKLGRPNKLTVAQQKAIVCWMAARDHTFYVKDLVAMLKEEYRFKGCDGTIRRAIVKAGYERKKPWHKSEVTVWIPPENPTWVTFSKKKKQSVPNGHGTADDGEAPSDDDDEDMDDDDEEQSGIHADGESNVQSGIDPALEQQSLQPNHSEHRYMDAAYQPATQDRNASANVFAYSHPDQSQGPYHLPPQPLMHHHQQRELIQQSRDAVQASQAASQLQGIASAQSGQEGISTGQKPKPKARAPRKNQAKQDAQELHPLESELQRIQHELQQSNARNAALQAQLDQQAYASAQQQPGGLLSPLGQPRQASPSEHAQHYSQYPPQY